jgi:hypothetical protein
MFEEIKYLRFDIAQFAVAAQLPPLQVDANFFEREQQLGSPARRGRGLPARAYDTKFKAVSMKNHARAKAVSRREVPMRGKLTGRARQSGRLL